MNKLILRQVVLLGAVLGTLFLQWLALDASAAWHHLVTSEGGRYADPLALGLVAQSVAAGLGSGLLLGLIWFTQRQHATRRVLWARAALLGGPPLVALIYRLMLVALADRFPSWFALAPGAPAAYEWAATSPLPPFWLGLVLAWLLKQVQRRDNRDQTTDVR